jgi:hypothetical protein
VRASLARPEAGSLRNDERYKGSESEATTEVADDRRINHVRQAAIETVD